MVTTHNSEYYYGRYINIPMANILKIAHYGYNVL